MASLETVILIAESLQFHKLGSDQRGELYASLCEWRKGYWQQVFDSWKALPDHPVVNRAGMAMIKIQLLFDDALISRLTEHAQSGGEIGIKPDARLDAQRLVNLTGLSRQANFDSMT